MISAWVACRITGNTCLKSPPSNITFPPNERGDPVKSHSVLCKHSKTCLWIMGASSQTIRDVFWIRSASELFLGMLHVLVSNIGIGILKREWAVLPPDSSSAAIPDDATAKAILWDDLSLA